MNTLTRVGALLFTLTLVAGCGQPREPDETSEGVIRYGVAPDGALDWGEDAAGVEIGKADIKVKTDKPTGPAADKPKKPKKKPVRRAGSYTAVAVADGGTISGTVKFKSKPTTWPIEYTKDQKKCGHDEFPTERVIFDEKTLGVANCVIYIADISKGKAWTGEFAKGPDDRTMLLDQKGCKYVPHILGVRVETQLDLNNGDSAEHNIHTYDAAGRTKINQMTAANSFMGDVASAYIDKAGAYEVKCDIHPWMSGTIWAFHHPYWVITAKDGKFELKDVPPGTYTVVCWHEGMREDPQTSSSGGISGYDYGKPVEESQKVTVKAGGAHAVDFVLATPPKSGK